MSALSEIKIACEMCRQEEMRFSGLEEWALVERGIIKSFCKKCSNKIKRFIKGKNG